MNTPTEEEFVPAIQENSGFTERPCPGPGWKKGLGCWELEENGEIVGRQLRFDPLKHIAQYSQGERWERPRQGMDTIP